MSCHRIPRQRNPGAILAALLALILLPAGLPAEPEAASAPGTPGERLYRIHCLNCHGEEGRGDGPMEEVLKIRPSDLGRLAIQNGGVFPEDRVVGSIDGRRIIPSHGLREMPVWGLSFQDLSRDSDQERAVEERIRQLVAYLESIQR